MSFHDRYIANKIKENWNSFPYKLDYIMHIVFSNNPRPSDIRFKNENGLYSVQHIKDSGRKSEDNINYTKYSLKEEELFAYLNYNISDLDINLDFTYNTQIFVTQEAFRCSAIKDYLSLRFLDTHQPVPSLFLGMQKQENKPVDKPCHIFNDKVSNYSLYIDLNDHLPNKLILEKKNKI